MRTSATALRRTSSRLRAESFEASSNPPPIMEYFVARFAKGTGKKIRRIDKDTLSLFRAYNWPGNIRELQNVVECAVILAETDTFAVDECRQVGCSGQLAVSAPRAHLKSGSSTRQSQPVPRGPEGGL